MSRPSEVPAGLRLAADVAWRLLAVAAAAYVTLLLVSRLRTVLLPVFVALLLCTALAPAVVALERRGLRPLLATWCVFLGFTAVVVAAGAVIVVPTVVQADDIATALDEGVDDVEAWLVDGPLHLERDSVEEVTNDPAGALTSGLRDSSSAVVNGIRVAGEVLAGAILAIVLTFLFLKDGRRFQAWAQERLPAHRRQSSTDAARASWAALSGYLRGAALLGVVEGLVIGATVALVGGPLAAPVALLTFVAAFFPIVGAIVAGVVAVLVSLASGGLGDAAIVGAVCVLVQQLDNDLLAPVIYGRAVRLHPAVILVTLATGGVVGGIAGAFVAVPVVACASAAWPHLTSRTADGVTRA